MRPIGALVGVAVLLVGVGCAGPGAGGGRGAASTTGAHAEGAPREELPWATFSPETFARAARERKYIVLDGSAEWCHWCHVMEATTYHDPTVRKILDEHFIAVKVDVDSRPDVEERYGDWGWPATIVFSPDATEIGKYRGYIDPEKFTEILKEVVASKVAEKGNADAAKPKAKAPKAALSEEHLAWIQHATDVELDDYWDETQGGWGRTQKAPLGYDNAWMLWRASQGDAEAKQKAIFSLDQQSKLIDPVWGGIYQYSAARHWDEPHFEKLMTFQAPALDNYAAAYKLTGEPRQLARAKAMLGYLERFMKSPEGGFYTTQDADVNAHDRTKKFVNGHDYYTKNEKERLALGLPRTDTHEYGRENGMAIFAYCTMYDVTKDAAVLASAEKAAHRILATHGTPRGGITHDAIDPQGKPQDPPQAVRPPGTTKTEKQLFLSDNASFGLALIRLFEITKKDEYLKAARAIGDFMLSELTDDDGGGLFAATKDPDAVGVFAKRRVPFEENVAAVRMFARLSRSVLAADSPKYAIAIDRILRAISTPEEIKARGRMLGDYLLALEESKGIRGVSK